MVWSLLWHHMATQSRGHGTHQFRLDGLLLFLFLLLLFLFLLLLFLFLLLLFLFLLLLFLFLFFLLLDLLDLQREIRARSRLAGGRSSDIDIGFVSRGGVGGGGHLDFRFVLAHRN